MKQYRVKSGAVPSLHDRKVVKKGDILPVDFFKDKQEAEELTERGFLEEYTGPEKVATGPTIYTVTEEDLIRCPVLVTDGIVAGDQIELPYEGFIEADGKVEKGPKKKKK